MITTTISYHTFVEISTPQNFKIKGYINNKRVTVFIDFGSTHNFIPCKATKNLSWFVYSTPEFQVMIANGGTINSSRKCHNININMGEYVFNSPMISILMGGVDVVLWVHWLLGMMDFNFHKLFMKFS